MASRMSVVKRVIHWDLVHKLIKCPEQLNLQELLGLCTQFFALQTVIGVVSFAHSMFTRSLSLAACEQIAFPLAGLYWAQDERRGPRDVRWWAAFWLISSLRGFVRVAVTGIGLQVFVAMAFTSMLYFTQWCILARLWCWLHIRNATTAQFYLNVVIENSKDAQQSRARDQLRQAGSVVDLVTSSLVLDSEDAATLFQNVEAIIAQHIRDKAGISATVRKELQRGNLVVVLVAVKSIDARKMLQLAGAQEKLKRIDMCLHLIKGFPAWIKSDAENVLLSHVAAGLLENVSKEMVGQICQLGGADVDVEVKSKDAEPAFLVAAMKQLDNEEIAIGQGRSTPATAADEVWPCFCGHAHARIRNVPTTQLTVQQVTCSLSPQQFL
ncbi:unnamed protein product [Polarella glacialis]|uniref:Uncharacterized protein n=1 Tax=Polarella glacialis TaxID=89957 RepID=A0A813KRV2_POLGL|nr:unnamed protein product [Polarella glacialis]